ncbi:MAG: sigma-54 dependent transcriptional regulator [Bryobacteraceae bacterium]
MIRTLLRSSRSNLEPLLSATLGADIDLRLEVSENRAFDLLDRNHVDVVIVDLEGNMSLDSQKPFITAVRERGLPVLAITDDERRAGALELMELGVTDQFRNPPSPLEMTLAIRRAYEQAKMRKELIQARKALSQMGGIPSIIGSSQRMLAVYSLVRQVADLDTDILITGESGTGKELVARAIHNQGSRCGAPFVTVSCGAIPEALIESELFGHEKGSFTGAAGMRQGLFETAGAGTLFLDEIGELSPNTQVKLLRALQEKEFTRVGGRRPFPIKARVLYATHRDLSRMVEEERFRRDLFFRINVINIQVPSLRNRPDDILALVQHFIEQFSLSCRKSIVGIRPSAMAALVNHDWPGNVRELQNAIHRAVIVAGHDQIELTDLPEALQDLPSAERIPVSSTFDNLLREFRRKLAHDAIAVCNGNKTLAAKNLQISRAYLHRLIGSEPEESSDDSRVA